MRGFFVPGKIQGATGNFFEMNTHTDIHAIAVSAGVAAACCPQHN